jgi:hypothetical protein
MKQKCYVLFHGCEGCGVVDEHIEGIFATKEKAETVGSKIKLFGGIAGRDFTRIGKYKIK